MRSFRCPQPLFPAAAAFATMLVLWAGNARVAGDVPSVSITPLPGLSQPVRARRGADGVIHVIADGPGSRSAPRAKPPPPANMQSESPCPGASSGYFHDRPPALPSAVPGHSPR